MAQRGPQDSRSEQPIPEFDRGHREGRRLIAERLLEDMTPAERQRAERMEAVLPVLRAQAALADREARLPAENVEALREAGLLGLVVPAAYGGLGGTLRDLTAATFTLGTVCPSTALAYFFHSSSASRGLLPLEALDAGLFGAQDAPRVAAFAEKVLERMGRGRRWLANFASESVKTQSAAVTISTVARGVEGGFRLSGVKSVGCATGVADDYLVAARLEGIESADGIALFLVPRDGEGVAVRGPWNPIGMRGSASNGIRLEDAFVAEEDALAVPGAFSRMMEVSRGSFVGNQLAGTAVYLGAAVAAYDFAVRFLAEQRFADTGTPIGESPMHLQLVGEMAADLETASLWLRRQLDLETREPPPLPKAEVVQRWRLCKGTVAEAAHRVAVTALKACGTRNTDNDGVIARAVRDTAMGLVQAFPAERGRLEAAKMIISGRAQELFGVGVPGR